MVHLPCVCLPFSWRHCADRGELRHVGDLCVDEAQWLQSSEHNLALYLRILFQVA